MQSINSAQILTRKFDFNKDLYLLGSRQFEDRPRTQNQLKRDFQFDTPYKQYRINNDVRKHLTRLQTAVLPVCQKQSFTRLPQNRIKLFADVEQPRPVTQQQPRRPKTTTQSRSEIRPSTSLTKVRFQTKLISDDWRKLTELTKKQPQQQTSDIPEPAKPEPLNLQTNELTEGEKLYIQNRRAHFFDNIKPYIKSTKTKPFHDGITILSDSSDDNETNLLNIF